MSRPKISIIICAHKEVKLPLQDYFIPIQAGAALSEKCFSSYVSDYSGDNISLKNGNYCELTCHYWAWKNLKNIDIIGLNHYRRYFDFQNIYSSFAPDRIFVSASNFLSNPYRFPNLEKIFRNYDIILPNVRNYPYNMATQYAVFHIIDDWNILEDVIRELSPEYLSAFKKTMYLRNYSSNYNMFITKWQFFDEYSEWLFKILFEVEKRCRISEYPVQKRIFGYMSERLINVYCEYKHLKIKHVPIIVLIDKYESSINPSIIQYNWWKLRNNLSFLISRL